MWAAALCHTHNPHHATLAINSDPFALTHPSQALIGYFDLDPNRVLDLVLDAALEQPRNTAFLALVPLFKRDAVVHLLGFKFHAHQVGAPAAGSGLNMSGDVLGMDLGMPGIWSGRPAWLPA